MLREIGLATGLLGKALDLFKTDDKKTADGVGGGMDFAALMAAQQGVQITQVGGGAKDASVTETSGMDTESKAALDYLHDMTAGGLEAAMKKAMQKIRDKVMQEMGVSQGDLDAMEPAQRAAMEAKIANEVVKRMKESMGASGTETAEERDSFAAKLMEMAKAYRSDVSIL